MTEPGIETDLARAADGAGVESGPAAMVQCDKCSRIVPVAPGFRSVSVPHARLMYYHEADVHSAPYPRAAAIKGRVLGVPCDGNKRRAARDEYVPDGWMLAHQYALLDDDRYWEGI